MTVPQRILLVVGVLAFAFICMGSLFAGLVYLSFVGVETRPLTESELALLTQAVDLQPYWPGELRPDTCEMSQAKKNFDGSLELEYEYDSDLDPDSAEFLLIDSEANIDRNIRDARENFPIAKGAMKVGAKIGGASLDASNAPRISLGDERYSALMLRDDRILGNVVVIRQGRITLTFMLLGLYFDDPVDLEDLLRPAVTAANNWETR